MVKRIIAGAIAAGALSVPLAGTAWADPPADRENNGQGSSAGDNGVGRGGVPGRLATLNDTPDTPYPPGALIADLRGVADDAGYDSLQEYLLDQTDYTSPGDIVSDVAHGDLTPEQLQDLLDGPDDAEG
jgi:hypothetical protein